MFKTLVIRSALASQTAVAITVALALCSCSVVNNLTFRPLPRHWGCMHIAGLASSVEILRDKWGVPNIYASNPHDLFFAQGFTQAQDRWWQMELYRHVGAGRFSELIGSSGIESDIYVRTLRMYETAQQEVDLLEPRARAMLEAFVEGVNAYILTRPWQELAMEYSALELKGAQIEVYPWSPADSLVFGKILQLQQCAPMVGEAAYEDALNKVGPARLKYWVPPLPYGVKPTIIGAKGWGAQKSTGADWVRELMRPALGSNSWIVSATLSETGRPLLENDPHLLVSAPALYYEIGLHALGTMTDPGIDVAGVSFSLFPAICVGHNAAVGWGLTMGKGVDQWDTYHIRVNPERPLEQYEWNGQWTDFTIRQETFTVAGAAPVTITIRDTVHGPIVNDILVDDTNGFHTEQDSDPHAVRWTCLEPGGLGNAFYRLATASGWNEFHEALRYWDSPPCNFSYADVQGNIGYQLAAKAPLRPKEDSGLIPAPGWSDSHLGKGYVPYDYMPNTLNPDRGVLVHTNQAAEPPEYFDWLAEQLGSDVNVHFQPTAYYGYRAERIDQLLEGNAPYSVEKFAAMQADVGLTSVDEVMPYLESLDLSGAALEDLRAWLAAWDRQFSADSSEATLYALFWTHLLRNVYKDEVPIPQPNDGAMYAIRMLLEEPYNEWWDDKETVDLVEDRDAILIRSLSEAGTEAVARFGADRESWAWGSAHTISFVNAPLGSSGIALLAVLMNRGPYPYPGAMETVNFGEWYSGTTAFSVHWASCLRIVLDVGAWDNSLIALAPGQSGHPMSRNYADQIDLWRQAQHRKMLWTRDSVLEAHTQRLVLLPQ